MAQNKAKDGGRDKRTPGGIKGWIKRVRQALPEKIASELARHLLTIAVAAVGLVLFVGWRLLDKHEIATDLERHATDSAAAQAALRNSLVFEREQRQALELRLASMEQDLAGQRSDIAENSGQIDRLTTAEVPLGRITVEGLRVVDSRGNTVVEIDPNRPSEVLRIWAPHPNGGVARRFEFAANEKGGLLRLIGNDNNARFTLSSIEEALREGADEEVIKTELWIHDERGAARCRIGYSPGTWYRFLQPMIDFLDEEERVILQLPIVGYKPIPGTDRALYTTGINPGQHLEQGPTKFGVFEGRSLPDSSSDR